MAGDLVYYRIPMCDGDRTKRLYGEVLGREFEPGSAPDGHQVANTARHAGISLLSSSRV